MATQRVKLDYNHLMRQVADYLSENSSEDDEYYAKNLIIGLELLTSYMKSIAERAIELNDDVLIELFKDLCVLKEKEQTDGKVC